MKEELNYLNDELVGKQKYIRSLVEKRTIKNNSIRTITRYNTKISRANKDIELISNTVNYITNNESRLPTIS